MTHSNQVPVKERQNKYGAVRCWSALCQREFASKAERARGEDLYMQERAGVIFDLEYQPSWVLCEKPKIRYTADFRYYNKAQHCIDGRCCLVVEDVKGKDTEASRVRRAWLKEKYQIEVQLMKRIAGAR